MEHRSVKEKILKHLNGLNELERQKGSEAMVEAISKRYDIPRPIVMQVISEWSAGKNGQEKE